MMDFGGENKRARIEGEKKFLFLEMYGELVGIDLGGDGGLNSRSPMIRCRIDLRKYDIPIGMRHVKIGDEHCLLGGATETVPNDVDYEMKYSDKVYHLNRERIISSSSDGDDIIQDPEGLITEMKDTRLKQPKFAMVSNLKGKHYLLHACLCARCRLGELRCSNVPFERLDVNSAAPLPPFYFKEAPHPPSYSPLFMNRFTCLDPYNNEFSSHLVIDDKLVLVCGDTYQFHIFTPPDDDSSENGGAWSTLYTAGYGADEAAYRHFRRLKWSYEKFHCGSFPRNGIFLSDFVVGDNTDLGVLLSFQLYYRDDELMQECRKPSNLLSCNFACYFCSFVVNAYVISRKKFKAYHCQNLAGVFSDMGVPDHNYRAQPPFMTDTVTRHLVDLGQQHKEGVRRFCAILAGDATTDGDVPDRQYTLLVSIFDVQLIQPLPLPAAAAGDSVDFLTVSPVMKKKLTFGKISPTELNLSYLQYKHVLDAFLI